MVGLVVIVGFFGMVLAPCALALYSKLGSNSDAVETAVAEEKPLIPSPPTELTPHRQGYVRRPVPLSTLTKAPVAVPSLREMAKLAANDAIQAQAEAAQARIQALQEASRAASRRAAAAEKLAEAAERELLRASQAALQAEAAKSRAKQSEQKAAEGDYLPQNHPSLDFPRSRVSSRRVA